MKIRHALIVLATGALLAVACKGNGEAEASFSSDTYAAPCTCGEPFNDLEGCSHSLCMNGQGNPDNPNCVCGPFSFVNDMEGM